MDLTEANETHRAISNAQVRALECDLINLPQVDLLTAMLVHGKMCARTIFIPKGTVVTGALTNLDNICVVYGDISVTTSSGTKRLTGFHVLPADKGFKRAVVALEDTHWVALHHTEHTSLSEIEKEMTDEFPLLLTNRFLPNKEENVCLGG